MSHELINQTSFEVEIYTPPEILEAARNVLGQIDLDPASSRIANKNVMAKRYFTKGHDGLSKKWSGNVWMNHPWGAKENACSNDCQKKVCKKRGYHLINDFPGNAAWINKLINSYEAGDVKSALCITYASTSEGWFKPLKRYPICLLDGRTSFVKPDGTLLPQNTKGCSVTYLGENMSLFNEVFSQFGDVLIPYSYFKIMNKGKI